MIRDQKSPAQFHTPRRPTICGTFTALTFDTDLSSTSGCTDRPNWIRKHTPLVLSILSYFRIDEHPPHASRNPLDLLDVEKEREREAEERRRDAELVADVAQRKKVIEIVEPS